MTSGRNWMKSRDKMLVFGLTRTPDGMPPFFRSIFDEIVARARDSREGEIKK